MNKEINYVETQSNTIQHYGQKCVADLYNIIYALNNIENETKLSTQSYTDQTHDVMESLLTLLRDTDKINVTRFA